MAQAVRPTLACLPSKGPRPNLARGLLAAGQLRLSRHPVGPASVAILDRDSVVSGSFDGVARAIHQAEDGGFAAFAFAVHLPSGTQPILAESFISVIDFVLDGSPTLYPAPLDSVRMILSSASLALSSLMATCMVAEVAPAETDSVPEFWMVKSLPPPAIAVPEARGLVMGFLSEAVSFGPFWVAAWPAVKRLADNEKWPRRGAPPPIGTSHVAAPPTPASSLSPCA